MVTKEVSLLRAMGFQVRTHADWKSIKESLYQNRRTSKPFTKPANWAFAHISVTRDDGPDVGDFDADMRELERIGYERFKSGISYNWAIDMQTGMIGEGQYLDAKGTHTVNDKGIAGFPYNLNLEGHAVAGIGMPGAEVSNQFILSFAAILWAEQTTGRMRKNAAIYPHSMFAAKDCPTDAIRNRLGEIRSLVSQVGNISDMEFTDKVFSIKDPDGSPLTVGEALVRGNFEYMRGQGLLDKYRKANGQNPDGSPIK